MLNRRAPFGHEKSGFPKESAFSKFVQLSGLLSRNHSSHSTCYNENSYADKISDKSENELHSEAFVAVHEAPDRSENSDKDGKNSPESVAGLELLDESHDPEDKNCDNASEA
jgi:hypothetical protein